MRPLLPCPFCGGAATQERHPWHAESIRLGCGNDACSVRPRTEYLLACYADELRAAWNARPAAREGDADVQPQPASRLA